MHSITEKNIPFYQFDHYEIQNKNFESIHPTDKMIIKLKNWMDVLGMLVSFVALNYSVFDWRSYVR